MWPLNQLPLDRLGKTYGFRPDAEWIEHVQKSCLRFGRGGSASFVSPEGLIMTNHHVGSGAIGDLSTPENDYVKNGFYARTRAQELKCSDLKVYQLMSIEDVTERVNAEVDGEMEASAAQEARDKAMAAVTGEAREETGLHPEIVRLYHGARFHVYLYKVYDDVRLVMAPEAGIAFFGGDLDNFGFPRYDLDVSFFRAYEDGQPAETPYHFKWSQDGSHKGEPVFVAGHPARTRRMFTTEHLEFLRDVDIKLILEVYNQLEVAMIQFIQRSEEHKRIGKPTLLSIQNGRKAYNGILAGLLNERIMQRKGEAQTALKEWIQEDEERQARYGDPWGELASAIEEMRAYYPAYFLIENRRSRMGDLYRMAKRLVRAAKEREKPDGERSPEYREDELESVKSGILQEAPFYMELEVYLLSDALTRLARVLGGNHPIVKAALAGKTPEVRAADIVARTHLGNVGYRRNLFERGQEAIEASEDPVVMLASALEPFAAELRERYEKEFESVMVGAYSRIAQVRFEKFGEEIYPDATHTLRLSVGLVNGYMERGERIVPVTRIGGAFGHAETHGHVAPFELPESWMEAKDRLTLDTPFNFVSTNDIIGGNSGSPTFNRACEIVGIIFDGNIQSLVWDIDFNQEQARAVSVHSQGITEALDKIYNAGPLVKELTGM
jgi:hypothetical protein